MRDELLYSDLPVAPPHGIGLPEAPRAGLRFSRSYCAELTTLIEHWTDPLLRQAWLKPVKASHFAITHAAPAYLEAQETDGVHTVRIAITFEDDGECTTLNLAVATYEGITPAMLIASGYADRWEERLYELTDQLTA